jgi:N-acetylglucosaminyldiphosphoundecaprenol N-acetyl-beta-D-mannosaminyltransferase
LGDVRILGVRLTSQTYSAGTTRLLEAAANHEPFRAHFCTVHSLVEASRAPLLAEVFESSDMVAMDGVPLVWVARHRGRRAAERVCGPDTMLTVCDEGRQHGLRHYFLGGAPGVPESLADRLSSRFPGLVVAGTLSPPFRPLTDAEDAALVAQVNETSPDVVWIGLGSPKQELWAASHAAAIPAVLLPVGAAFDFHSGRVRRAPRWMQRVGLEWLFRLAMEPRRLLSRYVATNSRFVAAVIGEELRMARARRHR